MKLFLSGPVNLFYSFILLYIIFVPVDSGFVIKFLACFVLSLIWLVYLVGSAGSKLVSQRVASCSYAPSHTLVFFILFFQFVGSVYVGYFYTGLSVFGAVSNFLSGTSNYALYQAYFADAGLAAFGLSKIPAILAYFYVKLMFVFMVYCFLVRNMRPIDVVYVTLSSVPVLMIGMYRGTNIEFFEVFIVVLCGIYVKKDVLEGYRIPLIKIVVASIVLVLIYSLQISFRYNFEYTPVCKNEFCYDENSVVYKLVPAVYALSGYFYFAPDYLARWLEYIVSDLSFFKIWIPGNGLLFGYEGKWLCEDVIKCGPTWAPDIELIVYLLGVPGALLLVFGLSKFFRNLQASAHYSFISFLGYYLVGLQLIALPIGNFLLVSSANQLMLLFFLSAFILRLLSRIKRG